MRDFQMYGRERTFEQSRRDKAVDYKWMPNVQSKSGISKITTKAKTVG